MKTKSLILIAATIGLIGNAAAEEGKRERPHRKLPPEVIEKFDKDGDGKLNEEERKAAKAAHRERMKAHREEMLKQFDKDGDGKLTGDEAVAARKARQQKMLEKFDKDGDGELSDGEKEEMRKVMGKHRRDGKGRRGPREGERKPGPRPFGGGEAPGVAE